MHANLRELAKVMRPISDERARELVQRFEADAGACPKEFVAAEHDIRDDYWDRSEAIERSLAPKVAYG
jgi:regulator of PEP synthase PpsR (kinase-PPPase family)